MTQESIKQEFREHSEGTQRILKEHSESNQRENTKILILVDYMTDNFNK